MILGTALLLYVGVLAVVSSIAAAALWWDKRQARRSGWRVPESTLHLLELLGGWPGSWLIRRHIRHKTRKRRYRIVFALIVLLHATLIGLGAWWLWKQHLGGV